MIGYSKRIEKILRESAFDEKKKKRGLKRNPGLAQTGVRTTGRAQGITAVLREIENNTYPKFWGADRVHYGKCEVAYVPILKKVLSFKTVAIFIPDWQLKN